MVDSLFYLFSALAVLPALAVVIGRNPVNSAMFMILSFASTAALFLLLEAWFLAALQILVYAGAVMVLFLFIVMLLSPENTQPVKPGRVAAAAAVIAAGLITVGSLFVFSDATTVQPDWVAEASREEAALTFSSEARYYGYALYTKYLLPVMVSGFLLLVAMIGVIVVSKRIGADGEPIA